MDRKLTQDEQDFIAAYQEDSDKKPDQASDKSDAGKPAGTDAPAGGSDQAADSEASAAAAMTKAVKDAGGDAQSGSDNGGVQAGNDGAVEAGATAAAGDAADPKDLQREKSWEGRLKARERDLEAREAKLREAEAALKKDPSQAAEAIEKVAESAEKKGDTALAQKADDLAEQVEDGAITPASALARLREDFGSEFMDMLSVIVKDIASQEADRISDGKVRDGVSALEKRTQDGFNSIGERHSFLHKEKIEEAFPDIDGITSSPKFNEFVAQYPGGEQIAKEGSARQVIKMLKAFKESQSEKNDDKDTEQGTQKTSKDQIDRDAEAGQQNVAQAQPSQAAIDAAAGVRSSGAVKLPEAPVDSGDYAGAWATA